MIKKERTIKAIEDFNQYKWGLVPDVKKDEVKSNLIKGMLEVHDLYSSKKG